MIDLSFQKFAYDKFRNLKVGALFMKMGSGKTKVAVDLANANADKVDRLLWVCPNQVKDSTIKELKKWSPRMRFRVIAYESLSQSERIFNDAMDYAKAGKPFLVLDESIFVKNGQTLRWKRCKAIRMVSPFCLILNGTPVVKNEMDLYWQMNMLDERIIPYEFDVFRRMFFDQKTYRPSRGHKIVKYTFSKQNAEALAKLVAPYVFKADVDYGITVDDETIQTSATIETEIAYSDLKHEALHSRGSLNAFMGYLSKMLHCAAIDNNRIDKTVELAKGKPCIVYASYVAEAKELARRLNTSYVIMGETPASERRRYLELFELMRDKPLILTFGTGSYGLNLQFASDVIFNSYNWNYGELEQAKARVLRIGQKNKVTFRFIESDLPIQKLVRQCVTNKMAMSEFVQTKLIENAEELL